MFYLDLPIDYIREVAIDDFNEQFFLKKLLESYYPKNLTMKDITRNDYELVFSIITLEHTKLFNFLLNLGLSMKNIRDKNILSHIIISGRLEILHSLLNHVDDTNDKICIYDKYLDNVLYLAIDNSQLHIVDYLLHTIMNIYDLRAANNYALHKAIIIGDVEIVQYILSYKDPGNGEMLTINDIRSLDNYALRMSAVYGNLVIFDILMQYKDQNGEMLSMTDILCHNNYILKQAEYFDHLHILEYVQKYKENNDVDINDINSTININPS